MISSSLPQSLTCWLTKGRGEKIFVVRIDEKHPSYDIYDSQNLAYLLTQDLR